MGRNTEPFNSLLNALLRAPIHDLQCQPNSKCLIVCMKFKGKPLVIEFNHSVQDRKPYNFIVSYNEQKYVGHLNPSLLKDVKSISYSSPKFELSKFVQNKETYTHYLVNGMRLQPLGWEYEVGYLTYVKEESIQHPIRYNPTTKVEFKFKVPELDWSDSYYDGKSLNDALKFNIVETETLTFEELGIPEHCYGHVLHDDALRIIEEYRKNFMMTNFIKYFSERNIHL